MVTRYEQVGGAGAVRPYRTFEYGRVFLETNNNWYSSNSTSYGPNSSNFSQPNGAGAVPSLRYNGMGMIVPDGSKIHSFDLTGRLSSDVEPDDVEVYIALAAPTDETDWTNGLSSNAQFTETLLWHDLWLNPADPNQPSFPLGAPDHVRKRTIDFDHTIVGDSYLTIYYRGTTVPATRRYFYTIESFLISEAV